MRAWFVTTTFLLLVIVQGIQAQFLCGVFNTCTTPAVEAPPAATSSAAANIPPPASTVVPPTVISSSKPVATSSIAIVSSPVPTIQPSSSLPLSPTSAPPQIPSAAVETPLVSSASTEATPSPSATNTKPKDDSESEKKSGSNIGVIIGSVCGFVAIIGAGFLYAFFSKTRRNNRDNKRLFSGSSNGKDGYLDNYPTEPQAYSRPSPAMAQSAVNAADQIHASHQWDTTQQQQQYGYSNIAPPMAVANKQHDPYYPTQSQMGYNDPYYNNNQQQQQQYYDPNTNYYEPQHYEPSYIDSQKQHDPYSIQPTVVTKNNAVYSAPHTYS